MHSLSLIRKHAGAALAELRTHHTKRVLATRSGQSGRGEPVTILEDYNMMWQKSGTHAISAMHATAGGA